jgi:hypothetical protein
VHESGEVQRSCLRGFEVRYVPLQEALEHLRPQLWVGRERKGTARECYGNGGKARSVRRGWAEYWYGAGINGRLALIAIHRYDRSSVSRSCKVTLGSTILCAP